MNKSPFTQIALVAAGILLCFFLWKQCNATPETVKVNLTAPQTAYSIPTIIAAEKGFFKKHNLEVVVNYVKTGKIAMDDLIGGKADFANVVETNIAFAGFNNPNFRALCNIEKVHDAAIIARKDKGIKTIADLKGKKVGVMLATTSQVFAEWVLEKNGITRDSFEQVYLLPPALQSAIIEGSGVDAISLWQPYIFNAQKALGDKAVVFQDKDVFTGYMNLTANGTFLQQHPDVAERMLEAYIEAEQYLASNPAECQAIVSKVISIDVPTLEKIWGEYEFKISMTREVLDATTKEGNWIIRSQKDFGGKTLPDYSKFFDTAPLKKLDSNRVKW